MGAPRQAWRNCIGERASGREREREHKTAGEIAREMGLWVPASDIELTNNLSDFEAAGTNAAAGTRWH